MQFLFLFCWLTSPIGLFLNTQKREQLFAHVTRDRFFLAVCFFKVNDDLNQRQTRSEFIFDFKKNSKTKQIVSSSSRE